MSLKNTVYLKVSGNDTNEGTEEHPVASLKRAVELARELPAENGRRILIGDGVYLDTSVTLDSSDSGMELVAAEGTEPAFYGGVEIDNWRPEGDDSPFWVADAPEGSKDIRTLILNGRFAPRARFPETGAITHQSRFPVRWMSTTKGGWERKPTEEELTTLRIAPDSLPDSMSEENAELTIYHCWDESMVGIRDWDRRNGIIKFSTPAGHPPGAFGDWKEQARTFVAWNTREGMTRPGQWYFDRENGRLVYWPLEEETSESDIHAIAPTRPVVLRLEGTEEEPVRDVRIEGLTFGVTTTPLKAGGFGALKFEGAIEGKNVTGLSLECVTVKWSGGQGIRLSNTDKIHCSGCTAHDLGAGGIILYGTNGTVKDTLIHHNGRTYSSSLGLRVSGECWRVHHNTLHHTPYSAVNAGGKNLHFEHNRFHHVMEELLDGAAIYIFGAKSCVLRGNYTYDVRDAQAHAYYLDEQSENSIVEGNVSVGVPWPIHNHMAWNCELKNNVCVNNGGDMHISFVNCDGFRMEGNVFVCAGEIEFETSYTGVGELLKNIFFSEEGGYSWNFHDRLPSLERNSKPTPALPRNSGSVIADPGCRCEDGRVSYDGSNLSDDFSLPRLDVSGAGCGL